MDLGGDSILFVNLDAILSINVEYARLTFLFGKVVDGSSVHKVALVIEWTCGANASTRFAHYEFL